MLTGEYFTFPARRDDYPAGSYFYPADKYKYPGHWYFYPGHLLTYTVEPDALNPEHYMKNWPDLMVPIHLKTHFV